VRRIERVAAAVAVTVLVGGVSACSGTMSAADPAATAAARASAPDRAAEATESTESSASPGEASASALATPDSAEIEVDPCDDYRALRTGLDGLTAVTPENLSAQTGDVLRSWGELTMAGVRPDGMRPRTWRGVQGLATRAAALPEEPTAAELRSINLELDDTLEWYAAACA
jgi:hypothetical protein